MALRTTAENFEGTIRQLWDDMAVYKSEVIIRPDYYVCIGARVIDFSSLEFEQLKLLIGLEVSTLNPEDEVLVAAANIRQN